VNVFSVAKGLCIFDKIKGFDMERYFWILWVD
jgi:hypothetical protein